MVPPRIGGLGGQKLQFLNGFSSTFKSQKLKAKSQKPKAKSQKLKANPQ
jgi:hypothetical protein